MHCDGTIDGYMYDHKWKQEMTHSASQRDTKRPFIIHVRAFLSIICLAAIVLCTMNVQTGDNHIRSFIRASCEDLTCPAHNLRTPLSEGQNHGALKQCIISIQLSTWYISNYMVSDFFVYWNIMDHIHRLKSTTLCACRKPGPGCPT